MDDDLAAVLVAIEELTTDPKEVFGMLTVERDAMPDARVNEEVVACLIG